jgi:hypothetical protein
VDEDDEIIEIVEDEPVVVEATPWFNSDTVATSMMFASQLAEAAATHFHNLAMLALGQSAHEWVQVDREEFADETAADISKIVVKEQDG